jgi:hydrogenase maturation factor
MNSNPLPEGKIDAEVLKGYLSELPVGEEVIIKPGIGRDAAGIRVDSSYISVATDPITFACENIGFYSVAVNINDIVCQGCVPRWYTACLLLPTGTTRGQLKTYWQDLVEALKRWNISGVGGHTEVTPAVNTPLLCGQLIGEPYRTRLLDPAGAKPGDVIYQWRPAAIEGLALMAREHGEKLEDFVSSEDIDEFKLLLEDPGICIWPQAEFLLKSRHLKALHDPTEGGLATAVHELAEAAGCGVEIQAKKIIWPAGSEKLFKKLDIDPLGLLSSGCLLVVVAGDAAGEFEEERPDELVRIGELTSSKKRRLVLSGSESKELPRFNQDQLIRAFELLDGISG